VAVQVRRQAGGIDAQVHVQEGRALHIQHIQLQMAASSVSDTSQHSTIL
jgi:hypothetical protein